MILQIHNDHQRFRKIVKGKIRKDLRKFLTRSELLGLEGKIAVVTGGAGAGMGGQHCRLLARAGCHVVVADIDEAGGNATVQAVEEIGRKGGRAAQVEIVRALCNAVGRGLSFKDLENLQILEERDGEFRSFDYLNLNLDLLHDAVTRLYELGNDVAASTIEDGLNRFYEIVQPDEDEELEEALTVAATVG